MSHSKDINIIPDFALSLDCQLQQRDYPTLYSLNKLLPAPSSPMLWPFVIVLPCHYLPYEPIIMLIYKALSRHNKVSTTEGSFYLTKEESFLLAILPALCLLDCPHSPHLLIIYLLAHPLLLKLLPKGTLLLCTQSLLLGCHLPPHWPCI